MGKAKNRRKQKKTTSKNKYNHKEVIDYGYAEVIRKGKHVFVRNKLTADEHAAYLIQLKENRPKFYDEIKEKIIRVADLINMFDKVFVIGGIAAKGYFHIISDKKDDGKSELAIEYCQSIALATPNTNKGIMPDNESMNQIYDLLVEIRKDFSIYYSIEHAVGKYTQTESRLRLDMITNTLFIRGVGYYRHIREMYLSMFEPHDDFLIQHYGFTSNDILYTFDKLEESFGCRLMLPDGMPHPVQTMKFKHWMDKNKHKISPKYIESGDYLNDMVKDHPEIIVYNNGVILYRLNVINTINQLFKIRHFNKTQEKVVQQLSMKFGDNAVFATPEKFKYEILNKSLISSMPIVEDDEGNYYLFPMNLAARNLFVILPDLIRKADEKYYQNSFLGNRVKIAKDEFIERKTYELFCEMLPNVDFYRNVKYNFQDVTSSLKCATAADGNYELDILGVSKYAIYLIEVKASIISDEAKRGALTSIYTDMSRIIGDAICQSQRARLHIESSDSPMFTDSHGNTIHIENKIQVFKISISFSYAGTIISDLAKLQEFGIMDEMAGFAWTINIFDLIPFVKLIASESEFIDYLTKRIPMYSDKRLEHVDEMDMLGLYYDNDLIIDKEMKDSTTVRLNAYKDDIDRYFERGGKKPVKIKRAKS